MSKGRYAVLAERGVVKISGPEARSFLQGLITTNMDRLAAENGGHGALLTPQGKVLFDFLIAIDHDGYLVDLPAAHVADFIKRLGFYKLRAKVEIADASDSYRVIAAWGDDQRPALFETVILHDPRLSQLGWRIYLPIAAPLTLMDDTSFTKAEDGDWHKHRIALGVPLADHDYGYGEVFPHDIDMDKLNGLDFAKGCYVGQEVVSRMEHRGTARKRCVIVSTDSALPAPGTDITAGGKSIGTLGSSAGTHGIAIIRLDRAKAALDEGEKITADDKILEIAFPAWSGFAWSDEAEASDTAD
ncbi:MAG: folate-binding protein YgfZ [Hyphomicrobiales bacterium]|nr:folate-binding protein YgfZ [Hyphomicrobiales bacterium]